MFLTFVLPTSARSDYEATGRVGQPFSFVIPKPAPTARYFASGLPLGLLMPESNVISGIPKVAGNYKVTISGFTAFGPIRDQSLTLIILAPAPVITSASAATGTVGAGFLYQITASNAPTYFDAKGLPIGLSVNNANGLIIGVPTVVGVSSVNLRVCNSDACITQEFVITVQPKPQPLPIITSAAAASSDVGQPFSYQIAAINNPSSFNAIGLPVGFKVNSDTGLISGTPTTAGVITVTLSASNGSGIGTKLLVITVNESQINGSRSPETFLPLVIRSAGIGTNIQLISAPVASAGVVQLEQAAKIEDVGRAPESLTLTNISAGTSLLWQMPAEKQAFFRALHLAGRRIEDYLVPDWEEQEVDTYEVGWYLSGVPKLIIPNASLLVEVILVSNSRELVNSNVVGQLVVASWADRTRHPDANVEPAELVFKNGIAVNSVKVNALTSLEGYTLAIDWNGRSRMRTTAKTAVQLPIARFDRPFNLGSFATEAKVADRLKTYFSDLVDTNAWANPLPSTANFSPTVVGSFGEWRGHMRYQQPNANVHEGLDLKSLHGALVSASRGGVIEKHDGEASGRYVVINHHDGTFSRYLHLNKFDPILDPAGGEVKRGARIGTVSNLSTGPHLHFEVRSANGKVSDPKKPGIGLDPLRQTNMFDVTVGTNLPVLETLQVSALHPAASVVPQPNDVDEKTSVAPNGAAYIIAKVRQRRDDNSGIGLSPSALYFQSEGGEKNVIDLSDEDAVKSFMPSNASKLQAGFALYLHGYSPNLGVGGKDCYRYWFKWDVAKYLGQPIGPRTLALSALQYGPGAWTVAGQTRPENSYSMKWGPEIISVSKTREIDASGFAEFEIRVRYWTGQPSDGKPSPWAVGSDWYEYEVSKGGVWQPTRGIAGGSDKATDRDGVASDVRVLKVKAPVGGLSNGWVRVRSGRVPQIAHLKYLPECGGSFTIYMGTFAGQEDQGGFACIVGLSGRGIGVGYNSGQKEGLFVGPFDVSSSGLFAAGTVQGGNIAGAINNSSLSGSFINSDDIQGGFVGSMKDSCGFHTQSAGYYTGYYTGEVTGRAFAILAADGTMFFYTIDNPSKPNKQDDGGGYCMVNSQNLISGTTVPNGLTISGSLDSSTKQMTGTYGVGGGVLGTFQLTRVDVQ